MRKSLKPYESYPMHELLSRTASRLPGKKELLDPDEVAGVEYGTTAKKDPKGTAQRQGTDALKINLGTGGGETGSTTGGLNV